MDTSNRGEPAISAPQRTTNCSPEVRLATPTEFVLVNPSKQSNFLIGELLPDGQLSFIVENFPKSTPQTGCPGRWMFQQMMDHFGASVIAVQGNWIGPASDNLSAINTLTARGTITVEEAAKQTWTGMRAKEYGFTLVELVGAPAGTAGHYTSVHVVFKKLR